PAAGGADRRRRGRQRQARPARDQIARGLPGARGGGGVSPDQAPLRRPRAILFDWDNTLVDSWATIHEARNFVMAAMGLELRSLDDTKRSARLSLRDDFPRIFGERWEEARAIYLAKVREIHLERLTALPGREAMLRQLVGHGIYMAVVSNKVGEFL